MNFATRIIVSAFSIMLAEYFLSGVHIDHWFTSLVLALVLSFLNAFVKPVLIVLTIPATIMTLGLFLIVVNALIVLIADWAVTGFEVDGFWWALGFSILISIINSILNPDKKNRENGSTHRIE